MKNFQKYLEESAKVDIGRYRSVHSKNPSGRGMWVIGIGKRNVNFDHDKEGVDYIVATANYKDAVKQAMNVAKKHGNVTVFIQP